MCLLRHFCLQFLWQSHFRDSNVGDFDAYQSIPSIIPSILFQVLLFQVLFKVLFQVYYSKYYVLFKVLLKEEVSDTSCTFIMNIKTK